MSQPEKLDLSLVMLNQQINELDSQYNSMHPGSSQLIYQQQQEIWRMSQAFTEIAMALVEVQSEFNKLIDRPQKCCLVPEDS